MRVSKSVNLLSIIAFFAAATPSMVVSEEIFFEDFEEVEDWTSTMFSTESMQLVTRGDVLPERWYGAYQGTMWSPELGYPDNHASIEILEVNADKARSGKKSAVMWRESYSKGWKNWASDGQLLKYFEDGSDSLYIEFYIRFSPNFYGKENPAGWTSKIFRVGSWSGQNEAVFSGYGGEVGPLMIWDYRHDNYGVRNVISLRGGPWGENYNFSDIKADTSYNYGKDLIGAALDGGNPMLLDKSSSDNRLLKSIGESPNHKQIFGSKDEWTKMAFYVEMNSAPGVPDGVLRQFLDGQQILYRNDIPWIGENQENKMVKWNYFSIGGNDYFQPYPNNQRFEDWYAIDDIRVLKTLPSDLDSGRNVAPEPPENLSIKLEL